VTPRPKVFKRCTLKVYSKGRIPPVTHPLANPVVHSCSGFPVNSYPNQVVPCKLVPKPTRTYYQLVPKPCRIQYQLVPNFTMYIRKRSTMQATKMKVDVINTRKKARSLLSTGVRLSVRLSRRSIVSRRTPYTETYNDSNIARTAFVALKDTE